MASNCFHDAGARGRFAAERLNASHRIARLEGGGLLLRRQRTGSPRVPQQNSPGSNSCFVNQRVERQTTATGFQSSRREGRPSRRPVKQPPAPAPVPHRLSGGLRVHRHSRNMETADAKVTQRGQRALPAMSSQDLGDDVPAPKSKRRKARKSASAADDAEDPGVEMDGLASRRASQGGEALTPEPAADRPPQRRRKKKKAATIDLEDDQADLVNGDGLDQNTDGEEVVKKPKKKKKSKVAESQLPTELDVEEDDIIVDSPPSIPQHSLFSAPQGQSQPMGKVFIERNKHFQAAERSDRRQTSDQAAHFMDFQPVQPLWTTRDVSLRVHEGFRMIGLFCHGFLAGYAVWNIVVVYMLAGQQLTTPSNLLQHYHTLAYPAQSLLYMLLAISTVAAFDRVNLARGSMALREFVMLDPVALASFLYFSALILSLSQQMTSDRINMYHSSNGTLWPPGSEHQILHPWVTVNLVVALLVGLAWIFISTRPEMDYTEGYLMAMEIESPNPEDKTEITA